MKIWYIGVSFIVLILLSMFVITLRDEKGLTLEEIQGNLTHLNNVSLELTQTFEYKNPYSNNFTVNDFIINTAHVIFYATILELNTVLGSTITFSYTSMTQVFILTCFYIIAGLLIFWVIAKSIMPIGVIFVFLQEYSIKKRMENTQHRTTRNIKRDMDNNSSDRTNIPILGGIKMCMYKDYVTCDDCPDKNKCNDIFREEDYHD